MRLLICAGGTGGGVYPALAVLETLNVEKTALDVLWVGGEGGMEARLVERAGLPFRSIPAAGVHGVGLRQLPGNLARLARGVARSRRILREFKPDVLFFTGGYVAVPMALAGWKTPSLLYVPDIEPGLALKTLSRFADRIAITADESRTYFRHRHRTVLTGYPVRPGLKNWPPQKARSVLGLTSRDPVVLILGGSKGARSINNAILANLPALLEKVEVIHITGELDWPTIEAKKNDLKADQSKRWHAYPYLHEEMGAALSAATLVISRSGASSLGEYPRFGLPAILVPYPHAWRYQIVNADYLVRNGAAVLLEDAGLEQTLMPVVLSLLEDREKMKSMQNSMRNLARPNAASEIGHQLVELAGERR